MHHKIKMADTAINNGTGDGYPGYTTEARPELFDPRAMLPQPSVLKPGQLSEEQVKRYFEKGYVVLEEFFSESELQPSRDCINGIVDDLAQKLYKAGKIPDLYAEYGFTERLTKIEAAFPGANIICSKLGAVPQAFKELWCNERLLNIVEQLIGQDIAGNPAWNLRTKVPRNIVTTVPWHQDVSYLDNDTYRMLIPTAWIPFVDATEQNGCLECCWGDTFYTILEEDEMKNTLGVDLDRDRRALPVRSGGLILFNNMIPHRSLPNVSDGIRWSIDLRWQRATDPAGLWGLKNGVVMRKSSDPNFKVDWTEFDSVNRHIVQTEYIKGDKAGPWMKKWEIVHMNKHVDRFLEQEAASKGDKSVTT
ncbi:PHNY-like protein [Mya arenaria]|uniref:PHNY-like protein n=1 Tax=Mya arenaria TaxID=6604 RepID=A0ABY7FFK7_MYAAR|nr:PHNY-like protein [Mya arenaria]